MKQLLVDFLIISVIIGFLLRGSLHNLARLEIKGLSFMIAAMLLQFVFLTLAGRGWQLMIEYGTYFYVLSFLLLLAAIWQNRYNAPFCLIGCGVFLNFLAIIINGGQMPVSLEGLHAVGLSDMISQLEDGSYITHTLLDENTRLAFLGDVFPTPPFYPRPKVFSIGDVVMAAGILWLIPAQMRGKSITWQKGKLKG